jgi:PleD family two-component response regulator
MNTDLIAAMAEKISLGILNAWDHETHVRNTLAGPIDGLYTEPFFMEYVHKELNRAWRTQRPFSILAVSWQSLPGCDSPLREEVHEFFLDNLRSADLVALGQTVDLWIVLPETDQQTAQTVAQRLASLSEEYFSEEFHVCFGITTFSRHAAVAWVMLEQARNALSAARHNPGARIVTQAVTPGLPSG